MKKNIVLVISNNPISDRNNNGHTMLQLFNKYCSSRVINFFISEELPSKRYCRSYFQVSDKNLFSFSKKKIGREITSFNIRDDETKTKRSISTKKRTMFNLFLRNCLWNSNRWFNQNLKKWLLFYKPSKIVFFIGDCAFMGNVTNKIAKFLQCEVVIYNTENQYFRQINNSNVSPFSFLNNKRVRKMYEHYSKKTSWIHLTDHLCNIYSDVFPFSNHYVIRNTPSWDIKKPQIIHNNFLIYYFGNFNLGRDKVIIMLADELKKRNIPVKICLFGKASVELKKKFLDRTNIDYRGYKTDEYVKNEVAINAACLLHVESSEQKYKESIAEGFSTKIPNCLASGKPLILFSPSTTYLFNYLQKNHAAFTVSTIQDFISVVSNLVNGYSLQTKAMLQSAVQLIQKNHNRLANNKILEKILFEDEIETVL